jgi:hypothetical protein
MMPRTRRPNKKGPDFASPYHQLKVLEGKKSIGVGMGQDQKTVHRWYVQSINGHHGDADGQVGRGASRQARRTAH